MKYLYAILAVILFTALFLFMQLRYYIHVSKNLIKDTVKFTNESTNTTKTLLVLGDSTAYGVGAKDAKDSLPALVAMTVGATYAENHSISGATIEDLPVQMQKMKKEKYDLILLQIGANNITARDNVDTEAEKLGEIIKELQKRSKRVMFLTAGNVGGAPAIPFLFRPYFTKLTLAYHEKFQALGDKLGVTYINLYIDPAIDPFVLQPKIYFAPDMFHPSSEGYKVWFATVEKYLQP